MEIRFYVDPASGSAHVLRHGVSEAEAIEVLQAPSEDRPGRDSARVAIGSTTSGRVIRVIYVPADDAEGIFVITAYELKGRQLAAFKRRRKKRTR